MKCNVFPCTLQPVLSDRDLDLIKKATQELKAMNSQKPKDDASRDLDELQDQFQAGQAGDVPVSSETKPAAGSLRPYGDEDKVRAYFLATEKVAV